MRWKRETSDEYRDRLKKWRKHFAWYPIKLEHEWVWLEKVYVRTHIYGPGEDGTYAYRKEYKDLMGLLIND